MKNTLDITQTFAQNNNQFGFNSREVPVAKQAHRPYVEQFHETSKFIESIYNQLIWRKTIL